MNAALMLTAGLIAQPANGDAPTGPPARLTAEARLECHSRWHDIDLKLTARGRTSLPASLIAGLPASGDGTEDTAIDDEAALRMIRPVHDLEWEADAPEAYAGWLGSGPSERKVELLRNSLRVKTSDLGGGRRVQFAGSVTTRDSGKLANRYGPNWWRDEWTHAIRCTATLDEDGVLTAFELTDEFRIKGLHVSDNNLVGENKRGGIVSVTMPRMKPLTPAERARVRGLVGDLGAGSYRGREKATAELVKMARANWTVVESVRLLTGDTTDAEVRMRVNTILRRAEDE